MMSKHNATRRRILRSAAAGAATLGIAGKTTAQESLDRTIVGLTADAGFEVATDRATEVRHTLDFGDIGKSVSGQFPDAALDALEQNPQVRYVEKDQPAYALQTTPYGIEKVSADVAHDNGETGASSSISIIDTGVQIDHETLEVVGGECFGTCCSDCIEPYGDDNGHGTHCAGTAAALDNGIGVIGVAPDVDLYSVKVLDSGGGGSFSDVAAGITWTADQGIDVASLSLGGSSGTSELQDAVQYADNQGTLVVAAAGNDGTCTDCVSYPAAYDEAVAVSATDENDDLASFSSTGPEIELAAPGVDVYSTYINNSYDTLSGTSMACPHVAGAAAHLMANGMTNAEARQQLQDTAEDIGLSDNEQGHGLLDAEAAVLGEPSEPGLSVSTNSATGVGETAATLNGSLNDLGDANSADVYFEWGEVGSGFPNSTTPETLTSTGSFSETISELSGGTDYEFRAVAETADDADTGSTQSFTTDSDDGDCFITTATAGEGHTLTSLRRFRDESMSATQMGRGLVGLYYRISPPIADTLAEHPESLTARTTRKIVDLCASLSDRQANAESAVESASIGVALTALYAVGILVGAGGHAGIRARELASR